MTDSDRSIIKDLGPYLRWLIAAVIAVPAILLGIHAIQSDIELLVRLGICAIPLLGIVVCTYVYLKKETSGEQFGTPTKRPVYSPLQRRLALLGLFIISIVLIVTPTIWLRYEARVNANTITVLVTQFDSPDEDKYRITKNIYSSLEKASRDYSEIKIKRYEDKIESSQSAQKIGAKRNADVVIWGWYAKTEEKVQIEANFENIGGNESNTVPVDKHMQNLPIAELDSLKVQTELSEDMTYLSFSLLGFSHYLAGKYDLAISDFNTALSQIEAGVEKDHLSPGAVHLLLGNLYVSTEQYEKALSSYGQSISYGTSSVLPYTNAGTAYVLLKKYDKAIEAYSYSIERLGTQATPFCGCRAYTGRGMAYVFNGEYGKAIQDFETSLSFDKNYIGAYQGLLLASLMQGDLKNAQKAINKAILEYPDNADLANYSGIISKAEGNYSEAIASFEKAFELSDRQSEMPLLNRGIAYLESNELEKAASDFSALAKLNPQNYLAWQYLGASQLINSQNLLAIESFEKAVNLKENPFQSYNHLAVAYRFRGVYTRAIELLEKAIEISPQYIPAHVNLGQFYQDLKEYEESVSYFEIALGLMEKSTEVPIHQDNLEISCELDLFHNESCQFFIYDANGAIENHFTSLTKEEMSQSFSRSYQAVGITYQDEKNYDKAMEAFSKAIELDSKNAHAYASRGYLHRDIEKYEDGLRDLNEALSIGFADDLLTAEVLASRGEIQVKLKNYDKAFQDLDRAINTWPKDSDIWVKRGYAYYQIKKYEKAVKDLNIAIGLNKQNSGAYFWRGVTFHDLGKYDMALEDFNAAIEALPTYDWYYYRRGLTHSKIGNTTQAETDFRKVIDVTLDSHLREQAQNELQK